MKYHVFIANEDGAYYEIAHSISEVRELIKTIDNSDILGIIRGGNFLMEMKR